MKEFCLLSILILFLYLVAVLFVQFSKKLSTKEAQAVVLAFIKDCFSSPKQQPASYYPVFIGIDENGCPHADIIEKEFHLLNDVFSHFYFHNCGHLDNRIWYAFNVSHPLKEMTDYDLIQYCEKVCNNLIHHYMHKKNPSITHINNMVTIHYQENILTVYIAITDKGTLENSNQTLQTRNIYNQNSISHDTTIAESWSDS